MRGSPVRLMVGLVAALGLAVPALAASPTYGPAVVDGDPSEWDLDADYFADMHRAGNEGHPLESRAYLRYQCRTATLRVLVLAEDGVPCLVDGDAWIAIDSQSNKLVQNESGNDGTPPDFEWVDVGYDGDPNHARGFEASFELAAGDYAIIVHVNVFDDGGGQTSATIGFPQSGPELSIDCALPIEGTSWSGVKAEYR